MLTLQHVDTFDLRQSRLVFRWLRQMPDSYLKDVNRQSDLMSEYIADMQAKGNLNTFVCQQGVELGFIQAQPITGDEGHYDIHFLCPRDLSEDLVHAMFQLYANFITSDPQVQGLYFRIHRFAHVIRRGLLKVGCQEIGREDPNHVLYWWAPVMEAVEIL